ncbi:MAG: hypothetical protein JSV88_30950 [Candidatus Aminicenantes bacterium]|nr:MAG: hypothetical protein JSV88_30950 [Candidatus Aminicenantes bacterium]
MFDQFLIHHLPGGYFYPFFIENYVPDATFLIEENNGFSLIDNPRAYFEGDSFVHFNWFYNGMNINSALNDGSPAVLLPFSSVTSYRLQGESPLFNDYGMNFLSDIPQKSFSRVMASSVYTDLGGYWLTFMIQPDHPKTRADRLYSSRRKIKTNYFLDYTLSKKFTGSHLTVALSYFDIQRQFNDFNTFDAVFNEDGKLFLTNTRFRKNLKNGYYDVFGIFNYLDRSHQQAEIGSYPQETTGKERYALLTGFALEKKKLALKLSFLLEKENLAPYENNFSKDLIDNDGDGIYPFGDTGELKIGEFSAATINLNLKYPLIIRSANRPITINTFADVRYSMLEGDETIHDYNAISVANTPYLVVLWNKGNKYRNINMNARVGMNIGVDISKDVSLLAKVFLAYDGLSFDNKSNNLTFFTPAFDMGIHLFKTRRTRFLFSYGILPYDIRENTNFFLEGERPHGALHWWHDANGDTSYQPGEEGDIFGYTGGRYHFVDENTAVPLKERLLLHLSTPLSRHFRLNIKGIYKTIKNHFRVKFNREYGFYESHENHDIYFFNKPFRDYYLYNGGDERDPFYAQLLLNIQGRRAHKWFFSFSFLAHIGMGDTALGNGSGSSDIGILDESQANPNSRINSFGRLDGDRGFVAKSYFGYYLIKKLFLAVSLKYRDGNPFAFFNRLSRYNQWVIYYSTIKAENEKGVKGGPREDYLADVSVKLSYHFKLFNRDAVIGLSFFNVLDFGGELSEYVFSGGTRDAVELQIPRSIRLTLTWKL